MRKTFSATDCRPGSRNTDEKVSLFCFPTRAQLRGSFAESGKEIYGGWKLVVLALPKRTFGSAKVISILLTFLAFLSTPIPRSCRLFQGTRPQFLKLFLEPQMVADHSRQTNSVFRLGGQKGPQRKFILRPAGNIETCSKDFRLFAVLAFYVIKAVSRLLAGFHSVAAKN